MMQIWYILSMSVLVVAVIRCVDNKQQSIQVNTLNKNINKSDIGIPVSKILEGGKVKMLLPDGWITQVFPGCAGLATVDMRNTARAVIFVRGLHQSIDPLPPGITPEVYNVCARKP